MTPPTETDSLGLRLLSMRRATIAASLALIVATVGCAPNSNEPSSTTGGISRPSVQATRSPSTRASPNATPPPSITVEPTGSPGAQTYSPDSYLATVSDGVRVRSKPGVGADSRRLLPLLPIGTELFVIRGPERAAGFDWYEVQPLDLRFPFGWVAAGRVDEPWVGESSFGCADRPADAEVLALHRDGRRYSNLVCYGSRDLTFMATMGGMEAQCGIDPCCLVEPCWLGSGIQDGWLAPPGIDAEYNQLFGFVFDPRIDRGTLPPYTFMERLLVEITGQFDHPASVRCRPIADVPDRVPAALATLACRDQFVVTAIRVLDH